MGYVRHKQKRSGYCYGNRMPIPVAIGPAIGHVQGTDRKQDQIHVFTSCCVTSSIEGIWLLDRIHLREVKGLN